MELRLTIALVVPPAASVPPLGEASSQLEVLARDQFSGAVPILVKEKVSFVVLNGPPMHPVASKPVAGVMKKGLELIEKTCAIQTIQSPGFCTVAVALVSPAEIRDVTSTVIVSHRLP